MTNKVVLERVKGNLDNYYYNDQAMRRCVVWKDTLRLFSRWDKAFVVVAHFHEICCKRKPKKYVYDF